MPNPLPPETTPEWTELDEESLREWASAVYEPRRGDLPSFRQIIAYAREIIRLRSEREAQDAEIAKLTALIQRVVDEHEIHDNDPLLFALLETVSQEAPWVVWSHERSAWWRANRQGYAGSLFGAGVYSEDEAKAIEDDSHRGDVARLLVDEFERQSRVVGTGANWLRTQLAASRVGAKPQNPCVVFGCECPECSASVISSASPLSEEALRCAFLAGVEDAVGPEGCGAQYDAPSREYARRIIDRLSSAPSRGSEQ